MVTKKTKVGNKPAGSLNSVTLKKGRRAVLTAVANSVKGYDKSKKRAALKRASAVLRWVAEEEKGEDDESGEILYSKVEM